MGEMRSTQQAEPLSGQKSGGESAAPQVFGWLVLGVFEFRQ
jgi:hypothetical protein